MSSGAAEAVAGIVDILGPAVRRALVVFLRTMAGMVLLSLVLVFGSYLYGAGVSALHGVLAALSTLAFCAIGGVLISITNSVTGGLCHAVDELDFGPQGLDLLFAQLLNLNEHGPHGERGIAAARIAENLPLRAAEEKLEATVRAALKAARKGGGLGGYFRQRTLGSLCAASSWGIAQIPL